MRWCTGMFYGFSAMREQLAELISQVMAGAHVPSILVVSGASGAGKTAAVRALAARRLPWVACHNMDSIGVPSEELMRDFGGPDGWQAWATKKWITRLVESPEPVVYVLDGQIRPSFVYASLPPDQPARVRIVLMDCSEETRRARLIGPRGQPELATERMNSWAAYLRGQADALGLPVIDTTEVTIEAAADTLETYLEGLRGETL